MEPDLRKIPALRKILLGFYYDNHKINYQALGFCGYDVYKIYVFVKTMKSRPKFIFDIYERLVEFLIPNVRVKNLSRCYYHLGNFNCLRYHPPSRAKERPISLVNFYETYNFNLLYPFRVLGVTKTSTRYGSSYIIDFCSNNRVCYKTWLPKSAFMKFINTLCEDPTVFNFRREEVYFRINRFSEYKGSGYATIDIQRSV